MVMATKRNFIREAEPEIEVNNGKRPIIDNYVYAPTKSSIELNKANREQVVFFRKLVFGLNALFWIVLVTVFIVGGS